MTNKSLIENVSDDTWLLEWRHPTSLRISCQELRLARTWVLETKKPQEKILMRGIDRKWDFEKAIEGSMLLKPPFAPGARGKAYYSDTNFQCWGGSSKTSRAELDTGIKAFLKKGYRNKLCF